MNWPVALILLPLLTGLSALLLGRPSRLRRGFVAGSALVQLTLALWMIHQCWGGETFVLPLGNWPARVGIVLVVDLLSAIMLALSSLIAAASILYGFAESGVAIEHPLRLPLVQFLVVGINLSFSTGDLFNLFVAFEIMLIASYALLTLEADDWDIKQAYPYVALNLIGSTLFICAAGLTYGLFGTLNFAEIAMRSSASGGDGRVVALGMLLFVVFAIKSGLFPLYYWLPNSYPTLPIPLAALYSGMLTKVGVYVLLRVFATVLPHDLTLVHTAMAWLAGITMLTAVTGAISRNFIRGILSFHILSQIGFMVLAIGFFTPQSIGAAIFYTVHHIIVKSSLFMIGGIGLWLNKTDDLSRMGNLWKTTPWLGALFLVQALSLAGVPPLSGFWGKYLILVAGLQLGQYLLVAAAILASVLTLFSMLKIWNGAFWRVSDRVPVRIEDRRWIPMSLVVGVLAAISLSIGLFAEPFLQMAEAAAARALDQEAYFQAVNRHLGKLASP
jgi:multicomponent Na+:H+ antiporter subunit D